MTLNWTAVAVSGAGALLGGIVGALAASARNRPAGTAVLVGAALGAIVGSVAIPTGHAAT